MPTIIPLEEFAYTKDWTNPADFPTYEGSEEQVRLDLQLQPDEIKAYLNLVKAAVNDLIDALDDIIVEQIPDNSVSPAKLQTGAVVTEKIEDKAVTTAKIALRAITEALLAQDSVTRHQIKDGEVVRSKIAEGAVGFSQIAPGSVTASRLGDGAVGISQLADGAVTSDKLASSVRPANVGVKHGTATPTTTTCPSGCIYLKHS
jgi:hypothetical protein